MSSVISSLRSSSWSLLPEIPSLDNIRHAVSVATTLPAEFYSVILSNSAEYQSHDEVDVEVVLEEKKFYKVILVSKEVNPELAPIFFIHGIWSSAKQKYAAAWYLKERGIRNNIYIVDLGQEDSGIRKDAEKLSHIMREILQRHHHPSRVTLLGHSRGGVVASYFNEFFF